MSDTNNSTQHHADDEIDLLALFGTLWDHKWLIATVTFVFTVIGVAYALLAPPVYRATSLIQVEDETGSLPGMEDLSGLLGSTSTATTEIQLIKSRTVLGKVVDDLNLDIVVEPNYFPIIGKAIARRFVGSSGEVADPLWGENFAWGGEKLSVSRMSVPPVEFGKPLSLMTTDTGWVLYNSEDQLVLEGIVGQPEQSGDYALMVKELQARPGTEFEVTKRRHYSAIAELQEKIAASEQGKDSGIISMGFEHEDYRLAETVLNEVGNNYVRQNVERNSAEAAKSLEFLRNKLPEVKRDLEVAEEKLNAFQITAETIDITAEGEAILEQVVELEKRISELEIQRAEIEQRFQPTHPRYKAWASQMEELKQRRSDLDERIGGLPQTQQELVRLRRDVEVGNEIYLQMLANIQQLDIVRAGTVGNVRVVDEAAVDVEQPVKPKKALIAAVAILLGGFIGVAIVLVRSALNRGVENADDIESIGLPVYAGIPLSESQEALGRKASKRVSRKTQQDSKLLALKNPADLAIEALRSLRTSLHFALMDAPNNILMICGPSPGVGKTFVSTNLAAVMAQADQRVLLIDADMRKGFSHETFNVNNDKGLSELLSGQATLEEVVHHTEADNLTFIPRGMVPPNPSELLMGKRFEDYLQELAPKYDLVIVDTPPILAVTDPAIVGKHAGTTMLVTRFGLNPLKEIELTQRRFEQNGIDVKGVIFNAVEKRASIQSYNGYGYYNYEYAPSGARSANT
ncbi:polysaccharide biosynthesis tyrosine autokinase [Marinobacter sp. SS21]|uniref:polysaccharide biosynthesis tyrosine autokinase n=1 Tax=Marinobacter sp. SS21 TaxID=2979460 RepID=UPI00232B1AA8|nr:polysaccharide biosynthesis tyrosine autokinase [Marinobacter sp. SS21]MDC0661799.1 polysaccharide biosynthesis tyrosine autokinase [Marinobacter sp. SS21]